MRIGQIKPVALAFTAVLLFSATAATAARASTEGPSWAVEAELQEAGETREVSATAKSPFILRSTAAKAKLECKAMRLKAGAVISGATSKSAGTSEQTMEFSKCDGFAKGEALEGCEPENGRIVTVPTVGTPGYSSLSRSGPVFIQLAAATGTTLATAKFTGEACIAASGTITGRLIGEVYTGGSPEEVGVNEVETVKQEIRFGTTTKTIWTESGGALTSVKSSLSILESAATLEGSATVELVSQLPFDDVIRRDFGDLYTFTPSQLHFTAAGQTKFFTIKNWGGTAVSLLKVKLVGGGASDYEIADTNGCTTHSFGSLAKCELGIKMTVANAPPALLEAEVEFSDGRRGATRAKVVEG